MNSSCELMVQETTASLTPIIQPMLLRRDSSARSLISSSARGQLAHIGPTKKENSLCVNFSLNSSRLIDRAAEWQ